MALKSSSRLPTDSSCFQNVLHRFSPTCCHHCPCGWHKRLPLTRKYYKCILVHHVTAFRQRRSRRSRGGRYQASCIQHANIWVVRRRVQLSISTFCYGVRVKRKVRERNVDLPPIQRTKALVLVWRERKDYVPTQSVSWHTARNLSDLFEGGTMRDLVFVLAVSNGTITGATGRVYFDGFSSRNLFFGFDFGGIFRIGLGLGLGCGGLIIVGQAVTASSPLAWAWSLAVVSFPASRTVHNADLSCLSR